MGFATKEARNAWQREYYQRNRQKIIARQKLISGRKYELAKASPKSQQLRMLSRARTRAKAAGLPYDLELDDVEFPSHCPILGLELSYLGGHKKQHSASPSLDRINPELGYVKGNVQVLSFLANQMKSNATLEQLRAFANYYKDK